MVNPEHLRRGLNLCLLRAREHALEHAEIHLDHTGRWLLLCAVTPLSLCPDAAYGGSAVLNAAGALKWQLHGPSERATSSMRQAYLPPQSLNLGHWAPLLDLTRQRDALIQAGQWLTQQSPSAQTDVGAGTNAGAERGAEHEADTRSGAAQTGTTPHGKQLN